MRHMRTPFYFISVLAIIGLFSSCRGDSTAVKSSDVPVEVSAIEGDWEIKEAYKNGKKSKLLDNGKINISPEGTFTTNILGDPKAYPFEFKGRTIKVSNPKTTKYLVSEVTPDTLKLSTKLKTFEFKLIATRIQ